MAVFLPRLSTAAWFGRLDTREWFDERFDGAAITPITPAGYLSIAGGLRLLGAVTGGGGGATVTAPAI